MAQIRTYTGRLIQPFALDENDVCLEDIAHHTANMCRFNGATRWHYSSALHMINCARLALRVYDNTELAKVCLLHDATDAYFPDLPRPLYGDMDDLVCDIESAQSMIYAKYGIDGATQMRLKRQLDEIDDAILNVEGSELINGWVGHACAKTASHCILKYIDPREVAEEYITVFKQIWGKS